MGSEPTPNVLAPTLNTRDNHCAMQLVDMSAKDSTGHRFTSTTAERGEIQAEAKSKAERERQHKSQHCRMEEALNTKKYHPTRD